jgi:hypothetical protein
MSLVDTQELHVTFLNLTPAEASAQANMLRRRILELSDQQVECEVRKSSTTSMDFGSTLVLVFGTPAAIAVAKGLYEALKRLSNAVHIETPEGRVLTFGDGTSNINVDAVIKALNGGGGHDS